MGLGLFGPMSQLREAICQSFCLQLGNREDSVKKVKGEGKVGSSQICLGYSMYT